MSSTIIIIYWLHCNLFQARNSDGKLGFVPENYIAFPEGDSAGTVDPNEVSVDADPPSSGFDSAPPSAGPDSVAPSSNGLDSVPASASGERVSAYSATDYEVQAATEGTMDQAPPSGELWHHTAHWLACLCMLYLNRQNISGYLHGLASLFLDMVVV